MTFQSTPGIKGLKLVDSRRFYHILKHFLGNSTRALGDSALHKNKVFSQEFLQETANFVLYTEEILNGKLHSLCSARSFQEDLLPCTYLLTKCLNFCHGFRLPITYLMLQNDFNAYFLPNTPEVSFHISLSEYFLQNVQHEST